MKLIQPQNAASTLITVTNVATAVCSLIDTAGSLTAGTSLAYSKNPGNGGPVNGFIITPEDGAVRLGYGITPTAALGMLLQQGSTYTIANVNIENVKLIRVSGNVKCSVDMIVSQAGEGYDSDATSFDGGVPTADSAANTTMSDVIGNKSDSHAGNSIMAGIDELKEHTHSRAKCHPTLAAGVTVTGGAGAWALGNYAVLVAANAITSDFDIHYVHAEAVSANDTYEIVLYSGADGAEVEIGRIRMTRSATIDSPTSLPFSCPIIPANTQIKAKVASSSGGGDTVALSIFYHTY